jgi:hypothetical protein
MTASDDRYWSAEEFADRLGIEPRWLEDRCTPTRNELPHSRFGRHLRFSLEHRKRIEAMFESDPQLHEQAAVPDEIDFGRAIAGVRKLKGLNAGLTSA